MSKLQDRLYELGQPSDNFEDDVSSSDSDTEDLLSRYAPAIKNVSNGIDIAGSDTVTRNAETTAAAANLSSTLRARKGAAGPAEDTATTSGIASGRKPTATTSPFAPPESKSFTSPGDNETLLSHHSAEQENLTDSLLQLATALKNSTLSFSSTLESSNSIVDRAADALNKNVTGLEAAERSMGRLRKLTEGRGLYARLKLYGVILALWVLLFLIMFVMPKLRF